PGKAPAILSRASQSCSFSLCARFITAAGPLPCWIDQSVRDFHRLLRTATIPAPSSGSRAASECKTTLPTQKGLGFDMDQGGDNATAELVSMRIGVRASESEVGDSS
ncbi:hypothetical protein, partial [Mesorhizobium sp. M7A.F.Ca.AU.002.02.1.1]|uniref:hypothetical protein n=2 Tax=unclassified Mesorhizobium TaxID=325217 RepID=UPI0019D20BB2